MSDETHWHVEDLKESDLAPEGGSDDCTGEGPEEEGEA